MLTPKELEIVEELCDSLSDVKDKRALENLLFEYRQYARCGSPDDCVQRKVGRPKKKKTDGGSTSYDNPPHFNSLEERDSFYK